MAVRSKQELRDIFVTGHKPTEQEFTDFIDSYIASINGITPSPNGEINVPLNYNIMNQLRADKAPFDFEEGTTVVIQTYVQGNDPNGWHEVFPPEVESGDVFIQTTYLPNQNIAIQQVDANRNEIFFFNLSRVSKPDGTWNDFVLHPFIRSINGVMTPYNGELVIPSEQKNASVFFRSASNQTVTINEPTMIFNGKDNNNISIDVDPDTGIFTLDPTKKYAFHVNPVVQLVNGASSVDYSIFSYADGNFTQITSQRGHISNDGATMTGSAQGGYFVVDGSRYPQIAIRTVSIGGGAETRAYGLLTVYSHVLIQEL